MEGYLDEGKGHYFYHIIDHAAEGEDGETEVGSHREGDLPDVVGEEDDDEDDGAEDGIGSCI